eukprot:2478956-Ditylum_brightwellii.AAC.1
MNVYKFIVKCMFPKETLAPDDPGSHNFDGAFSNALELYLWSVNIPRIICLEFLRRRLRFITDHSEDILGKTDLAQTPTEEGGRRNEEHELWFDLNDTKVDVSDPDID